MPTPDTVLEPAEPHTQGRGRWRDDRGTLTLWSLAICIALLAIGGLTIDFWRAIAGWQDTAAVADGAAAAGASGIDHTHWRNTDEIRLDPSEAERLAASYLERERQAGTITDYRVHATPTQIEVDVDAQVRIFLPRLVLDEGTIDMSATATADPRPSAP